MGGYRLTFEWGGALKFMTVAQNTTVTNDIAQTTARQAEKSQEVSAEISQLAKFF